VDVALRVCDGIGSRLCGTSSSVLQVLQCVALQCVAVCCV